MNTIVIYYSFTGNNATLAAELVQRLHCECFRITEFRRRTGLTILLDLLFKRQPRLRPAERDLRQYDQVVLVAPVWGGKLATPMAAFIEREKANFRAYSFLTICTGPSGQLEKIGAQLLGLAGQPPLALAELRVNDLLPPEHRNSVKHASRYRISRNDLRSFGADIERFVQALRRPGLVQAQPCA